MNLPPLSYPWYWHITVSAGPSTHINTHLKRRSWGLFRNAITNHGSNYIIMEPGEEFSDERAHEIREQAEEIFDTRFSRQDTISKLTTIFPKAKISR